MNSLRSIKLWLWIAAVCALLRGALFLHNINAPLALEGQDFYQVRPGQSLAGVLSDLQERGIVRAPFDLRVYARLKGIAGGIHAGEYALSGELSGLQLLQRMARGQVHYRQLVLVEGWTAAQAVAAIQRNPHITATLPDAEPETLRRALALEVHPEGQFFPETYNFTRGATDLEILRRAHDMMRRVVAREWEGRDVGLPYESPYQALIMASLVEKETAAPEERQMIAGVFVRRLRENMRLQTDPAVIYGLGGGFDGNLTRADLRADNPYNTYLNRGLPPTPIALPGRDAIAASLHPAPGDALYFVSKGDGTHHFSATLEEHNAAVRRYQIDGAGGGPSQEH